MDVMGVSRPATRRIWCFAIRIATRRHMTATISRSTSMIFQVRIGACWIGLITEESDQYQYRFKDIVDPDEGKALFTIEPEVRSMKHPLFFRPPINRNPSQGNIDYAPDCDARDRGMTRDEGNNQGES